MYFFYLNIPNTHEFIIIIIITAGFFCMLGDFNALCVTSIIHSMTCIEWSDYRTTPIIYYNNIIIITLTLLFYN